ncbi:Hypp8491 [Branchiostoma lanceolatum]|uniref:Hypp8491 protein n=1 Tax=Branchiostoma lanceolatum TaxID=7740 RepID=A0A8J9Z711_BRALA|nr:Hypp8491 [Branchiostoma lanceolatum]
MDEEKRARFVEWSCNVFVDVFWYFGVPRLWSLYYEAGVSWDEASRRIVMCRGKVMDSMWHWIQQDRRVDLNNIHFLQRRPELRQRAECQRYVCPHPLPPATILLNEICYLDPPEYAILEFCRAFNRLMTHSNQYGNLKYSAFLSVTLCCVEQKLGNKVLKRTWGGSVPLPKHLREIYIKHAARWIWHPIVSLPILISLDQTEEGEPLLGKVRVVPENQPILSCRAFQFHQGGWYRSSSEPKRPPLQGVKLVPPCSQCKDMFPSHDPTTGKGVGYVQYKKNPLGDARHKWCRGNCAEVTAFSDMFYQLELKCHVVNGDANKVLAKYKMDKMPRAKFVKKTNQL